MMMAMHEFSPHLSGHVSGSPKTDGVTCYGITGIGPDGQIPETILEECQIALNRVAHILAEHDLGLTDISHLAYMIAESETFAQCQRLISEVLGAACPAITLRVTRDFRHPGQRLEINFIAGL